MDQSKTATKEEQSAVEERVGENKEAWEKPAIVSFEPIRSAEASGGSTTPDGISSS